MILRRSIILGALSCLLPLSAGAARLFTDTFSIPNNQRPTAWKPTAGEAQPFWTTNNAELFSGDVRKLSTAGASEASRASLAVIESPGATNWTDYFLQVDAWSPGAEGGIALVLRHKDSKNFYEAVVQNEGQRKSMRIDKVVDGKRSTLVSKDSSANLNIPDPANISDGSEKLRLRFIAKGDQLAFQAYSRSANALIEATDSTHRAGTAGIGAVGTGVNFKEAIVDSDVATVYGAVQSAAAPLATTAPAAPASGGKFRVRVGRGLESQSSKSLIATLKGTGFDLGEAVSTGKDPSGVEKFDVLYGSFDTELAANSQLEELRQRDFPAEGVIRTSPVAAAPKSAPANPGANPLAAPASASDDFRVLVFEFPTRDAADRARAGLVEDDYLKVDVVPEGGKYRVYVGNFRVMADAERYSQQMALEGYTSAKAVKATATPKSSSDESPASIAVAGGGTAIASLSAGDQQKVQRLQQLSGRAERGDASPDEMTELRNSMRDLKEKDTTSKVVTDIKTGVQQSKKKDELIREFESAVRTRNFKLAEAKLAEATSASPNDPVLALKRDRLDRMMSETNVAKESKEQQGKERLATLLSDARAARTQGELSRAQAAYQNVLNLDATNVEARSQLNELNKKINAAAADTGSTSVLGNMNIMLLGIVAVVLVVMVGFAFVLLQNTRREKELISKVNELATTTNRMASMTPTDFLHDATPATGSAPAVAGALGAGGLAPSGPTGFNSPLAGGLADFQLPGMPAGFDAPSSAPSRPAEKPSQFEIGNNSTMPLPASQLPGAIDPPSHASDASAPAAPAAAAEDDDVIRIDGESPTINLDSITIPERTVAESAPALSLDELLKGTFPGGGGAAAKEAEPESDLPSAQIHDIPFSTPPPVPPGSDSSDALKMPEVENAQASLAATGTESDVAQQMSSVAAPAPPASASESSIGLDRSPNSRRYFHFQNFDDETAGVQPEGWQGDYDYASLTIDETAGADGGKCLKFEKRAGSGSANYICRFPKASGHVVVEFDIRCDEKNKYLLGFYIEKDEDFKQSVHTILHRIDSKSQPSLRIQGEPTPYDFTTWRHVRYDLNMMTGVLSATVDGQPVVTEARLATIPAYVNSLSIRDNLATTGVLYLDNIQIYRA